MAEKQTEMSLDEMLSSIKQMVIDKDPPVLELTDMVSPDGTIIKLKSSHNNCSDKSEMRDFLRLAQEESNSSLSEDLRNEVNASDSIKEESPLHETKENPISAQKISITVSDVVREIASPIIKEWLDKNLENLVKEIVMAEVQKMVKQN